MDMYLRSNYDVGMILLQQNLQFQSRHNISNKASANLREVSIEQTQLSSSLSGPLKSAVVNIVKRILRPLNARLQVQSCIRVLFSIGGSIQELMWSLDA